MKAGVLHDNRMAAVEVLCDFSALDAAGARAWESFIRAAAVLLGRTVSLGSFSGTPSDGRSTFAFISDSAALSRRILLNVPRMYICPHAPPRRVDPFFYWKLRLSPDLVELDLEPRTHRFTLLSSVFRGDDFLPGFLHNCAQLQDYRNCEHFLVRAASPGNEHELLVGHVRQWPSAVYLNLAEDPGLYEVWNLGIRLASGRYLSNANIDDRRAPGQLVRLGAALDTRADVSAAAAVLRISTEQNLDWEDSADCPLMFGGVAEGTFAVDALFRKSGESLAARNLLHCMPVWRREMHACCGFFHERRYGPSADWAFWLGCGARGARFFFDERPLGLYLRHAGSYWRRNPETANCDARIAAEFAHLATAEPPARAPAADTIPFSLQMNTVLRLLRSGAALEGFGLLLEALRTQVGPAGMELASRIGTDFLGSADWPGWLVQSGTTQGSMQAWGESLYSTLVDAVHATALTGAAREVARVRRTLEFACFDLYECGDEVRGLLLFAFLARCCGELALERELLRYLHAKDAPAFWSNIQSAYRFTRTLPELCATLPDWAQKCDSVVERPQDVNLVYFPEFSGNAYLDLLYRPLREAGAAVSGTSDIEHFTTTEPVSSRKNILHVHWIKSLIVPSWRPDGLVTDRAGAFLAGLARQRERGFAVHWTIHNHLSHECTDPAAEIAFRRALYALADRVFVHHPIAAGLLDWLPDQRKLRLYEHGAYELVTFDAARLAAARAAFGFSADDFIVTHVGRVRDYKGLVASLPVLLGVLERIPRMKLVVAGKIGSHELRQWLAVHQHPRLIVRDAHLDNEELALRMQVSNLGLLSYASILTSGTLFLWLSSGRPVLAPAIGTIPAYLVDGWNGFSYTDPGRLEELLLRCASLPDAELARLGANALNTARQLEWRMLG